jgi:hypothetical protein
MDAERRKRILEELLDSNKSVRFMELRKIEIWNDLPLADSPEKRSKALDELFELNGMLYAEGQRKDKLWIELKNNDYYYGVVIKEHHKKYYEIKKKEFADAKRKLKELEEPEDEEDDDPFTLDLPTKKIKVEEPLKQAIEQFVNQPEDVEVLVMGGVAIAVPEPPKPKIDLPNNPSGCWPMSLVTKITEGDDVCQGTNCNLKRKHHQGVRHSFMERPQPVRPTPKESSR